MSHICTPVITGSVEANHPIWHYLLKVKIALTYIYFTQLEDNELTITDDETDDPSFVFA